MEHVQQFLTSFYGLAALLFGAAVGADRLLNSDAKSALARIYSSSNGPDSSPFRNAVSASYEVLRRLFSPGFSLRFVFRSIFMSVLVTLILLGAQYLFRQSTFIENTAPFLRRTLDFEPRVIGFLITVLLIDTVSIYQTMIFIRISRGCRHFGELIFVTGADIALSFVIFIILLPLFLTWIFLMKSAQTRTLDVLIASANIPQSAQSYEFLGEILAIRPPASSVGTDEWLKKNPGRGLAALSA